MPKLKTHKGLKKVLKKRKNTITIGHPKTRHNTGKKPASVNRKKRVRVGLSQADKNRLKNII